MKNRTEKLAFHVTPRFKEEVKEIADEHSLSVSELLRRGAVEQLEALK